MSFFDKPVRGLLEDDLQWLVSNNICETDRLDYKRDMYGRGDEERRELLRDVTALANHRGGRIVIGIDENDDSAAKEVVGVPPSDDIAWIQSLCLSAIDQRILGLEVVGVPLRNGRVAVVIDVPLTASGPHMITFKGLNQFWKRHGRQKDKMTVEEIGDRFFRVADAQTRLERFLINRHGEIIERSAGRCSMVLSAVPVFFRDEPALDVRSPILLHLAQTPPPAVNGTGRTIYCGPPRPTLEGVAAQTQDGDGLSSLRAFRNGYIEFTHDLRSDRDFGLMYAGVADSEYLVSFVGFAAQVYSSLLNGIPMLFRVVIVNAHGMVLAARKRVDTSRRWDRPHLDLGTYVLEDPAQEWQAIPKQVCDHLWNAFGYEECDIIDEKAAFRRA